MAGSTSMKLANIGCGTTIHEAWENYDFAPSLDGVMEINLLGKLHLPDSAYEAVYSSHVLEHLPRSRLPAVLREFRRILRKGGILRVAVPDLEKIAELYLESLHGSLRGEGAALARHEWMTIELLDQMTRPFPGGYMGRLLSSRPLPEREFIEQRIGQEGKRWLETIDRSAPIEASQVYEAPPISAADEIAFRATGEIHRWMYDRVSLARLMTGAGFAGIRVCGAAESSIAGFSGYCLDTDELGETRKPDSLFMEGVKADSDKTLP